MKLNSLLLSQINCFHKKQYIVELEAEIVARKYGKEVYDCPHCGAMHLKTPKKKHPNHSNRGASQ